jgi:hypothetical protein
LEEGLKVGCGFILGVVSTVMFLSFSYFASVSNYSDEESEKKALYGVSKEEFQYYNVKSKKRKATIHTGMPKDSVILLLGEPTEFTSSDYIDEIVYRYGKYDINSLRIEFRKGKVKNVSQY